MVSAEAAAREMAKVAETIRALIHIPSKASPEAAKAVRKLLVDQFLAQRDPYGKPWKKLAPSTVKAKGHSVIGIGKNKKMLPEMRVAPLPGAGVGITFGASYSVYFNRRRPLLPGPGAMPPKWEKAIWAAVDRAFAVVAKRSGGTNG